MAFVIYVDVKMLLQQKKWSHVLIVHTTLHLSIILYNISSLAFQFVVLISVSATSLPNFVFAENDH